MKLINLSENVMVSDPCYSNDTWCQTKLNNVLPGQYKWDVDFSDDDGWGNRVSGITVLHDDYIDDGISLEWEDHSEIGVDSGQAGIFCMTGYRNDEVAEGITTPDSDFHIVYDGEGEKWYEKMCKFTLSKDQYGVYDTGMVSSSGIGDGVYPVEVMKDKEKIVGIRITYLGHSDKELFEDDGDVCGVCGGELESDGTCDYCNQENQD